MENQFINFKQERDFGQVFDAAFNFIKVEFKRFGKVILYYVVPILVIAAICMTLLQKNMFGSFGNLMQTSNFADFDFSIFYYYALLVIVGMVAYTTIVAATFGYIKIYLEKGKDGFEAEDVLPLIIKFFFSIIGLNILMGIIVGFGIIFCVIPGIYFLVSLTCALPILILEDKGIGYAISRSFELTKQQWWRTFGIMIVAAMMVGFMSYVFIIPTMITTFGSMFTSLKNGSTNPFESLSILNMAITSVLSVCVYLLYIVLYLIMAFQYFNLVELKEKPSLQQKIDQLGQNA